MTRWRGYMDAIDNAFDGARLSPDAVVILVLACFVALFAFQIFRLALAMRRLDRQDPRPLRQHVAAFVEILKVFGAVVLLIFVLIFSKSAREALNSDAELEE